MEQKLKTLGELRARVNVNPNESEYEHNIRVAAAELIDLIDGAAENPKWNDDELKEWLKLKDLAMIAAEQSAMWAVKADTY